MNDTSLFDILVFYIFHPIEIFRFIKGFIIRKYNYIKIKEITFITLIILIFAFAFLVQLKIINLPWLVIHSNNIENFYLVVFQIQAVVSTLGITVISLISGFINKKYFGISITDFLLNLRPHFLKLSRIIIASLLLILLDFCFISVGLYNFVSAIMAASIFLLIYLTSQIFKAFGLGNSIKDDIKQYILKSIEAGKRYYRYDHSNDYIIYLLTTELDISINNSDNESVYDITDVINKIMEQIIDYSAPNRQIEEYEYHSILRNWEKCIYPLLYSNNERYIRLFLKCISQIYVKSYHLKIHTSLWKDYSEKFFDNFMLIDPTPLLTENTLRDLRIYIYDNILEDTDTWQNAVNFLPSLYKSLISNKYYMQLQAPAKQKIWDDFVKTDTTGKSDLSTMIGVRFLTEPRKEELNKLLKLILNNNDMEIFETVFPLGFDYREVNLSITFILYSMLHNNSTDTDTFKKIKHLLFINGEEFYFYYIAKNIKNFKKICQQIIFYIRENKTIAPEYLSIEFSLDYYEKEFMFYYILYHLKHLSKEEIINIIAWLFTDNRDNLFNCFYFKGDKEKFIIYYENFLKTVLGGYYFKNDKDIEKALAFCEEYFSDYV